MATIKVIVKEPGKKPEVKIIKDSLQTLQTIVGGYIEAVGIPIPDVDFFCDEEGKMKNGVKPNFYVNEDTPYRDLIFGTVVFVGGNENGGNQSLTSWQIKKILSWLEQREKALGNERGPHHVRWAYVPFE